MVFSAMYQLVPTISSNFASCSKTGSDYYILNYENIYTAQLDRCGKWKLCKCLEGRLSMNLLLGFMNDFNLRLKDIFINDLGNDE